MPFVMGVHEAAPSVWLCLRSFVVVELDVLLCLQNLPEMHGALTLLLLMVMLVMMMPLWTTG